MQVGDLSRTHVPRERHDNAAFQAMRVLLVIGLMSAGWLALWLFQEGDPATEGMVAAAPPQTIAVETRAPNPPDRRPGRVQTVDAEVSIPLPVAAPKVGPKDTSRASLDPSPPAAGPAPAIPQPVEVAAMPAEPQAPQKSSRMDTDMTGALSERANRVASYAPADGSAFDLVDLNRGSFDQLNKLKGAGSLGRAIIRGRPYSSVEDLVKKRVVRRTAYERIKDQVTVQ